MGKTREPMIGDPAKFIARYRQLQREQTARFLVSRQRQLDRMGRDWQEYSGVALPLDSVVRDDESSDAA